MKRSLLATAVALSLGVSATADAGTAGLTGVWTGTYSFAMFSPGFAPVGAPTAPQAWSWDFGAGTITIANTTTFYASVWTAHNVTFVDNGDGTYGNPTPGVTPNMLFDWSVNLNIPVDATWDVTDNGNGTLTVASVSTTIMPSSAAFPGFHPTFTGTLGSAVPVPAAVWLMGSGLIGLVGVARRRRS
ncbi:MAG: VPLPA-CTERM sorting domain-containing protein [Gammaproteobacteria bacterium]|nr:VPLPA-CTERM sorting domain-containing protein [Gammaproteobacteria bacterium]